MIVSDAKLNYDKIHFYGNGFMFNDNKKYLYLTTNHIIFDYDGISIDNDLEKFSRKILAKVNREIKIISLEEYKKKFEEIFEKLRKYNNNFL